jgi:hypothetical protein
LQVLADGSDVDTKQLRHQLLSQPDGFILHPYLNAAFTSLSREDQELSSAVAYLQGLR